MTEVFTTAGVRTETRGAVPKGAVSFAANRIGSLLRTTPEPVLFARVTLTMSADPAVRCPAVAEANVDLNGRLIHVTADGETMHEAVQHAADRLGPTPTAARRWMRRPRRPRCSATTSTCSPRRRRARTA
jgi:ribosome-associated translation inhibitor RaiA